MSSDSKGKLRNDNPRVSIGLPVFNGERFLEAALDSILSQTFQDFELIISDNASTDRTGEICESYAAADRRIRYLRNPKNVGAANNYNRVFEPSRGEYFKWAAHDDVCAPTFIERCVEVLDQYPDVALCYPRTSIIDEQGEFVENSFDGFNFRSPKPHIRFSDFLRSPLQCNAIAGLIRRNILKKTPLIGSYASSDRVLLGELALQGELYEVPEYLFYRRIHAMVSTRAHRTVREMLAWFDPSKKRAFPRWRRFFEYLKSLARARLAWHERIYCYIELGRFYMVAERWKNIWKDINQVAKRLSTYLRWGRPRNHKHVASNEVVEPALPRNGPNVKTEHHTGS